MEDKYCDVLLALCMEIDPVNCSMFLVEADVIEAFKTGTTERAYTVIWNQEFFFPSHEYVVPLGPPRNLDIHLSRMLLVGTESGEFGPVLVIYLFC